MSGGGARKAEAVEKAGAIMRKGFEQALEEAWRRFKRDYPAKAKRGKRRDVYALGFADGLRTGYAAAAFVEEAAKSKSDEDV